MVQAAGAAIEAGQEAVGDCFVMVDRGDMSIADIAAVHEEGANPVLRTPHIGNFALYNVLLASRGIPMAAVETTTPAKDKNYNPGYRIADGEAELLIGDEDMDRMTSHLSTTAGTSLVAEHSASYQDAFPGTHIRPLGAFFREGENERVTEAVLRCLTQNGLGEFTRMVDSEGVLHDISGDPDQLVNKYGFFHSGSDGAVRSEGIVLPNSFNVLLSGILESVKYGTDEVYHLSGPDMVVYARQMSDELDEMYAVVRDSSGLDLPERLNFNLAPAANARLLAVSGQEAPLMAMLQKYDEFEEQSREINETKRIVSQDPDLPKAEKKAVRDEQGRRHRSNRQALAEVVAEFPELFAPTRDRNYPTQYDVLRARDDGSDGLFVPDITVKTSLGELGAFYQTLANLHEQATGTSRRRG